MINRVLIRIKVVQLLYSYLLTQNEFKIESPVENASRDKKYGYDLYMDLLLLVLELSGIDTTGSRATSLINGLTLNKHIHRNQLAKALNSIDTIRETILLGKGNTAQFREIAPTIYEAISDLPAYKQYAKIKQPMMSDDVELWLSIITNLIEKNPYFMEAARSNPQFTVAGFNRGVQSLLHTLSDYGDTDSLLVHARISLDKALDQAYDLYNGLLLLAVEITRARYNQLERAKEKFYPTDEDLHPNMRFVENKFVRALTENETFHEFVESERLNWETEVSLIDGLINSIISSETYAKYMAMPGETTFQQDAELWRNIFKDIIFPSDELAEVLESKSIYWNDDLHIMGTFVLKTIKQFAHSKDNGAEIDLLPKFKDEEDRKFGPNLFISAVKHYEEYRNLVEKFVNTSRWDADRLAFMDIVIMVTAITEILDYPSIPLAVSLNEYIEIANAYSTPRSGAFINGILYSVTSYLKEEGRLNK
ncbi:MAG: hypothetical protein NC339_06870 [Muribaculaceae bacterium]|nr:hypothetical protein [Muribaculaceae bacterium]